MWQGARRKLPSSRGADECLIPGSPARSQGSGLDIAESGRAARVPYPVDGFHFCG